jgi:hypothetical protein
MGASEGRVDKKSDRIFQLYSLWITSFKNQEIPCMVMTSARKITGLLLIIFAVIMMFILVLVKINIDAQEAFLCDIVHSTPDFDVSKCPAHQSNNSWLIFAAFGVSFAVLGIGVYLVIPARKIIPVEEKIAFKEVDLSKLDDDEKKVYNILKSNDGSMYQSDLLRQMGFSKVQMTRLLDKLAARKIIDRKRRGMTNIVILN